MRNKLTRILSVLGLGLALAALAMFESLDTLAKPPGKGGSGGDNTPRYEIYDLHPGEGYWRSWVTGVNDDGLVVGTSIVLDDPLRDVGLWWALSGGEVIGGVLPSGPITGDFSTAGINNHGEIAGEGVVDTPEGVSSRRALFWPSIVEAPLVLEPPMGYDACYALAINDDRVIVGRARRVGESWVAVAWRVRYDGEGRPEVSDTVVVGEPLNLPGLLNVIAKDLNNARNGVVCVVGYYGNWGLAVGWELTLNEDGSMTVSDPIDLDVTQGDGQSRAYGVNDLGEVCGVARMTTPEYRDVYGFVLAGNQLNLLPTPRNYGFGEDGMYRESDLNNWGEVVGVLPLLKSVGGSAASGLQGAIWSGGSVYLLHDLVSEETGLSSHQNWEPKQINNNGDIVGVLFDEAWGPDSYPFLMVRLNPLNQN